MKVHMFSKGWLPHNVPITRALMNSFNQSCSVDKTAVEEKNIS